MKQPKIPNPMAISLKVVFTAALLMVVSFGVFAKEPPTEMARLSQEIARGIEYPEFLKADGQSHDQLVKVTVTCAGDGTITVGNVESNHAALNAYVKDRLEGRKLDVQPELVGKPLTFTIKFNLI